MENSGHSYNQGVKRNQAADTPVKSPASGDDLSPIPFCGSQPGGDGTAVEVVTIAFCPPRLRFPLLPVRGGLVVAPALVTDSKEVFPPPNILQKKKKMEGAGGKRGGGRDRQRWTGPELKTQYSSS